MPIKKDPNEALFNRTGLLVDNIPVIEVCTWVLDNDFPWGIYWQPGCRDQGVDGQIAEVDDEGPLQWGWKFCPFCGTTIIQRIPGA